MTEECVLEKHFRGKQQREWLRSSQKNPKNSGEWKQMAGPDTNKAINCINITI